MFVTKATLIGHDGLQSPQFGDSLSMQECTLHCSFFFLSRSPLEKY